MPGVLKQVNRDYIPQIWDKIEPFVVAALAHSAGEYDAAQLKVLLVTGAQNLLIIDDEGKITGAIAVSLETFPNARIAFLTAVGGRAIASQEVLKQLQYWCRAQGCTRIRGAVFDAGARLWRQRFKAKEIYRIAEIEL